MFNCYISRKNLSALADNELPKKELLRLTKHLNTCPKCETAFYKIRGSNLRLDTYFETLDIPLEKKTKKETENLLKTLKKKAEKDPIKTAPFLELVSELGSRMKESINRNTDANDFIFDISPSGEVVSHSLTRIISVIVATIGFLLLFAPKLIAPILT